MSAALPITKSNFLLYLACPPEFWYNKHRPELFTAPPGEEDLFTMRQGQAVEALARNWFKPSVTLQIEYQTVFQTDTLYARADVVLTNPQTGERTLVEIKSGTKVTDEYLYDLAFQCHVARENGILFDRVALLHIDNTYVRRGGLDIERLFVFADVTRQVGAMRDGTTMLIRHALDYLSKPAPTVRLHECCGKKLACPVVQMMHPGLPHYTVFHISRIDKKVLIDCLQQGIVDIKHVPETLKLSEKQRLQVRIAQSGEPHIETERIRASLNTLRYPLYFLDYETLAYAIPLYDALAPYQQMTFQWSLHIVREAGAEPEHLGFLSDGSDHPALHFVEALRAAIPPDGGSVVVWNKSFEVARNKELAAMSPQHADFLLDLNNRVYDLMEIFQKQDYAHPAFKGSYSIKNVLPVLAPHLSYEGLPIHHGMLASIHWHKLATGDLTEAERLQVMDNLRRYCGLDTLAMVEVWRVVGGCR
ncbi:MAG: DUF2779 domain-containing protein [Saprospiraceae bacterium]|nr:DUF2779 domain-containing protein [Saprospiraceae bacterium]